MLAHRLSSAILKADDDHGASCVTSLQFRFISSQTAHHNYDARKIHILIPTIPIFILLCKERTKLKVQVEQQHPKWPHVK